jgi:16S rRNA (guanine966-N2)-methyltransferase
MRITGGTLRGRQILVPKGRIRPTTDMVREALFSILVSRVEGSRFLDLFAGSGAVGLEAWSRGAEYVHWVELDRLTIPVLKKNINSLCDSRYGISHCDAARFVKKELAGKTFDIIFADPPYDKEGEANGRLTLLESLRTGQLLAPEGVFVLEQGKEERAPDCRGWELTDDRVYGNTRLRFFKAVEASSA